MTAGVCVVGLIVTLAVRFASMVRSRASARTVDPLDRRGRISAWRSAATLIPDCCATANSGAWTGGQNNHKGLVGVCLKEAREKQGVRGRVEPGHPGRARSVGDVVGKETCVRRAPQRRVPEILRQGDLGHAGDGPAGCCDILGNGAGIGFRVVRCNDGRGGQGRDPDRG